MDEEVLHALLNLIRDKTGVSRLSMDDDLELDIGLTGDDALELLEEYGRQFHVDINGFPFDQYFYDEVYYLLFCFQKWIGHYRKKRITIRNLLEGIECGYLM